MHPYIQNVRLRRSATLMAKILRPSFFLHFYVGDYVHVYGNGLARDQLIG
jgi:hypothetical protein